MSKTKTYNWFKFEVQKYLAGDIMQQTDALQGVFTRMWCHYWIKECNVTYEQMCKKFKKIQVDKLLSAGILKRNGDRIRIYFLDDQWSAKETLSEKNSLRGKKGAEKVWRSDGDRHNHDLASAKRPLGQLERERDREEKESEKESAQTIDLREQYLSDFPNSSYFDTVCRDLNRTDEKGRSELRAAIPFFRTKCRTFYPRMSDMADHFKNWFTQVYQKEQPQQPEKSKLTFR